MKSNTKIDQVMAQYLFEAMLEMPNQFRRSHFACIGITSTNTDTDETDIYCMGTPPTTVPLPLMMEQHLTSLKNGQRGVDGDRFMLNSNPGMSAVKTGRTIVIFYSQAGLSGDEAVAIVYGIYQNLLESRGSSIDDVFSDILLCHVGEWQKNNRIQNEMILGLAQKVFKPELLKIK